MVRYTAGKAKQGECKTQTGDAEMHAHLEQLREQVLQLSEAHHPRYEEEQGKQSEAASRSGKFSSRNGKKRSS